MIEINKKDLKLPRELDYTIEHFKDESRFFLESKKYMGVYGTGSTLALAEKDLRNNIKVYLEKHDQ